MSRGGLARLLRCGSVSLLVCSAAVPAWGQQFVDPFKLLAEADRLAWLRVWPRAEPLYGQARQMFIARGDRRNALYAEVSQLRGQLPRLAVPDVSERLAAYLDDPVVRDDDRLRLRVLAIKGETGRVQAAYGANYARLLQIKDEYDPHNLFNQNITRSPIPVDGASR